MASHVNDKNEKCFNFILDSSLFHLIYSKWLNKVDLALHETGFFVEINMLENTL